MSEKIFHWTNQFKTLGEDDDGGIDIKGSASTNSLDRAGDIIEPSAWANGGLENYKNNPVVLFNHDHNRPIGRAKEIGVSDGGLDILARISKSAGEIKDLIKDGVLGAFSVGFKVKDADYISETDGYKIKDAELFEVSVVSVPCNQNAVFQLSKAFDSMEEYNKFKNDFIKTNSVEQDTVKTEQSSEARADKTETNMSEESKSPDVNPEFDLEKFAKDAAEKAVAAYAMKQAEQKAADEAAKAEEAHKVSEAEAVNKAAEESKQEEQKSIVTAVTSGAAELVKDIETRVNDKHEDLEQVVKELQSELKERSEEIMNIRESKRIFQDRRGEGDWRKAFAEDVTDAKVLGLATGRGYDTEYAKDVMTKINAHSGVGVSSADFEQTVSTNIERDIQNELVLAPLFREIPMTAANMIIPILPDSGYAEFTANQTATGSSPHGNLAQTGDTYGSPFGGVDLTEKTLNTKKLISQSYLGNETEEDAILPILPLIRESIVRSHAKGIENAILLGNHSTGVYTSGTFDGLVTMAAADSDQTQSTTAVATDTVTAAELLSLRKKYGQIRS